MEKKKETPSCKVGAERNKLSSLEPLLLKNFLLSRPIRVLDSSVVLQETESTILPPSSKEILVFLWVFLDQMLPRTQLI